MLYKYNNGGEKLKKTSHPSPLNVAWSGPTKSIDQFVSVYTTGKEVKDQGELRSRIRVN